MSECCWCSNAGSGGPGRAEENPRTFLSDGTERLKMPECAQSPALPWPSQRSPGSPRGSWGRGGARAAAGPSWAAAAAELLGALPWDLRVTRTLR